MNMATSPLGASSLLLASTKKSVGLGYVSIELLQHAADPTDRPQGARFISEHLLSTYGENYFAILVDEGSKRLQVLRRKIT